MMHYERSYGTARFVFSVLEFFGWATVVVGGLMALFGLASGGLLGQFARGSGAEALVHLMAALPGLGVVVGGVFAIAQAQNGRTHVDMAEMTRELLALARRQSTHHDPAPHTEAPAPPLDEVVDDYRGVAVARKADGYYVKTRRFATSFDARNFIDQALDQTLKAER